LNGTHLFFLFLFLTVSLFILFFFSSRRRHTRWPRDWSSDVCSSDLETLKDTARNLEALNADFIVIRHSASGAPHFLARVINASVINAGDGAHEQPTQALLDTFTIREKKGRIEGLNVTILGDILYSRVARSNIWALTKLGAKVTLCGPATLVPRVFEQMGCRVTYNVDEAVADADIINLLRIQHERQRKTMFPSINEYTNLFGLNKDRLARTKPDV